MASSSSVSVFDNYRFKSAFNEELYNSIVKNKKVIAECCIDLDEDEYPEVKEQIVLRGWRRLAAPKQEISIDFIHEFYANAILTEEEMEEAGGHTFRSYVRGKLDQVLANLCIPGATWKLSTGQLRVPIQLRRQELNPVARGWHEFSIHSLIPSSNRSEIPVIRAILIHCIMMGEDVRAEDIIADKIVRMAQGIKEKGMLGFPSTIFKLCKEAGVPLREFRRTRKIQAENPINARRMESTRLPRPVQQRQHEDEDEPMPQAEEGNEEQAHDYDYHHQPEYEHHQHDYEQPQPEFEHHQDTQPPPPPPYEPDQALMKIREQHATFTEICRQLKEWTRNASGRECYTIWAHQLANPNLVEMSSQKIVKQIYDNIDHKRPMFKGLLKSDLQPSDPTQHPSSSKDPKDPPSSSKDPKDHPK
ncbi:hypothetical protein PIB30_100320 [Stylosanthes scabra]|uniref:Putative plant transposon protein domain-containing protein n=1 Tax=Stylosanthes scabra TaxID=79078 RepID=A0ABU6XZI6_9FABA|nr:hypothetical protein [Stylosanthes scabra]